MQRCPGEYCRSYIDNGIVEKGCGLNESYIDYDCFFKLTKGQNCLESTTQTKSELIQCGRGDAIDQPFGLMDKKDAFCFCKGNRCNRNLGRKQLATSKVT